MFFFVITMVFFVCGSCQESLKIRALDGHRCTGAYSCVDCGKDFSKSACRSHNVCISEGEKYEKSLWKGGGKAKKADPQEIWTAQIAVAVGKASKHRDLMTRLLTYANVPRKQPAFIRFAQNSLRVRDDRGKTIRSHAKAVHLLSFFGKEASMTAHASSLSLAVSTQRRQRGTLFSSLSSVFIFVAVLKEMFELIMAERPPPAAAAPAATAGAGAAAKEDSAVVADVGAAASGGVKRKRSSSADAAPEGGDAEDDAAPAADSETVVSAAAAAPFNAKKAKKAILRAVSEAPEGRIKLKRLRKAVLPDASAVEEGGSDGGEAAAFEKALAKLQKKGKVSLDETGKILILQQAR